MTSQNRTHASDRGKAIIDFPDTPTIGTATAGTAAASVTFTAKATGGTATSFTVISSPGSITGTGTSSPINVTGLTVGTSYTFTVRANNSTGSSTYSSSSNSVTPIGPPAGYSLWLDAADSATITQSGGTVSKWTDKSANAYTFSQSTSTYQPAYGSRTLNGKNLLDFDGTNDRLQLDQTKTAFKFMNNTQTTWFLVAHPDTPSSQQAYFATEAWSGSRTGIVHAQHGDGTLNALNHAGIPGSYNVWIYEAKTTTSLSTSAFYSTVKSDPTNGTAANRVKVRINNGSFEGSNTYTSATGTNDPENAMTIGALWDNYNNANSWGTFLNGGIGEIIIYPSLLSDADIESVRSYLASKWGI